jgi:hypothetical protein
MSSELKPHLHLEVGHILFLDIVGYSKLLADEQKELVQELNQIEAASVNAAIVMPCLTARTLVRQAKMSVGLLGWHVGQSPVFIKSRCSGREDALSGGTEHD